MVGVAAGAHVTSAILHHEATNVTLWTPGRAGSREMRFNRCPFDTKDPMSGMSLSRLLARSGQTEWTTPKNIQ
jgi:hypothetical protein